MYKIFDTADEASRYTAQRLLKKVQENPSAALGLATGGTMEPVYAQLIQMLHHGSQDVSRLTTFNLDEYIGLSVQHTQSYGYYMNRHFFNQLRIPQDRVNLPDGMAKDIERACQAYSAAIQARGGLEFQLLGIGSNGHIGFNEPQTSFSSRTHVVELSEQTRIDNGRFFTDQRQVPTHAITMGLQDILETREIVLVATGRKKAGIMAELFHSSVDEALPASILKQHHNVTFVLDREAAASLPHQLSHSIMRGSPAELPG